MYRGELQNRSSLQAELSEWLSRSEILWRQNYREILLKEGDKNSEFFHLSTIIWRRRNWIDAVKSDNGEWITEKKEISYHFVAKFMELFSEGEVEFPTDLENIISPCITVEENAELSRIPTHAEI